MDGITGGSMDGGQVKRRQVEGPADLSRSRVEEVEGTKLHPTASDRVEASPLIPLDPTGMISWIPSHSDRS